jgi:hypothetical protein
VLNRPVAYRAQHCQRGPADPFREQGPLGPGPARVARSGGVEEHDIAPSGALALWRSPCHAAPGLGRVKWNPHAWACRIAAVSSGSSPPSGIPVSPSSPGALPAHLVRSASARISRARWRSAATSSSFSWFAPRSALSMNSFASASPGVRGRSGGSSGRPVPVLTARSPRPRTPGKAPLRDPAAPDPQRVSGARAAPAHGPLGLRWRPQGG